MLETRERTAIETIRTNGLCKIYHFAGVISPGSVYPGEQTRNHITTSVAELIFERVPYIEAILVHGTNLWISKTAAVSWECVNEKLDECWAILQMPKLTDI